MSARASFVLLQKRSGDAAQVAPRRSKRPAKYDSSGHIIAKLLPYLEEQPTDYDVASLRGDYKDFNVLLSIG